MTTDRFPDDVEGRVRGEVRAADVRPWVMVNMVTSIDGATAIGGTSTELSDPEDRRLFRALRSVADTILVGAGTVRAEDYRPTRGLVIVSGSLDLDPGARVFTDPDCRPTILTVEEAGGSHLDDVAEVIRFPRLDGSTIVGFLSGIVLCEGGPTLNGHLLAAGVVDEINWTISPTIVLGAGSGIVNGGGHGGQLNFRLNRAWSGERSLFLRYLATR